MTTIAYRSGTMAADSGAKFNDTFYNGARKLTRGKDGTLYGVSGNAAQCCDFLRWIDEGETGELPKPDKDTDSTSSFIVLAVSPGGPVRLITAYGTEMYRDGGYQAIGYDCAIAYGALYAGATAEQAIAAAVEHGTGTSGKVQTISHNMEKTDDAQLQPDHSQWFHGESWTGLDRSGWQWDTDRPCKLA